MRHDLVAQTALNTEHTIRPQPGDYWHEMFVPIALVVWTDGEYVEYLDRQTHYKSLNANEWTFDTEKPMIRSTIEEFSKHMHYETISNECWVDVIPTSSRMMIFVNNALEFKRKTPP